MPRPTRLFAGEPSSPRRLAGRCAIALLLLLSTPLLATEIERELDVGPGGRLIVEAEGTSIEVVGGGRSGARLLLERPRGGAPIGDDYEVSIEQRGNDVVVSIEKRRKLALRWRDQGLKLTALVPGEYGVEASSSGGSISVASLAGDVDVRTSGGSLSIAGLDGSVIGRTSGGSIRVGAITGDADVSTSGGSISVGAADGRVRASTSGGSITIESGSEVVARTSGGSIEVREVRGTIEATTSGGTVRAYLSEQPTADCHLSSSGGSVEVFLAEDLALDLDAHASGGRVSSELPVSVSGSLSRDRLRGNLNGGGPELRLRSSGGGVRIRSR
ncbi:MAG TPA: DUF4097 family beta strand repeat-containing protein [Thermoanaerobaculia bacterium]|nr:DUF4097 family beta strand repeat-containing protein [Thermoanaerobaculia bacterium]